VPRWDAYDAMLFDLDGVVLATATLHAAAWKRLFDEFLADRPGQAPFDIEHDYRLYLDGRRRTDGIAAFLASRGVELPWGSRDDPADAATCNGLGRRKNGYFLAALAEHGVHVFPDAVVLLDALLAAGKQLAVVSASENAADLLDRAGLRDRFTVLVSGREAARWGLAGKPAPDMFLRAAGLLTVPPGRAVVLEDAVTGVAAGRAGGFGLVVGVDRDGQAERLLDGGADVVVPDLTELVAGAAAQPVLERRYEAVVLVSPSPAETAALDEVLEALAERGAELRVAPDAAGIPAALADLARLGIGEGLVLVLGGPDAQASAGRATTVPVAGAVGLLRDQLRRRTHGLVPDLDEDPGWTVVVDRRSMLRPAAQESVLTVADTRFGTRGALEEDTSGVLAAGVFDDGDPPALLEGPGWTSARIRGEPQRRVLDLRTGVLLREQPGVRTMRFASLAAPGVMALRVEGAAPGSALTAPDGDGVFVRRQHGHRASAQIGALSATAVQHHHDGAFDRIVAFAPADLPHRSFDVLLARQRAAWARRWAAAEVAVEGDADLERAVRFCLFSVMATVPDSGEAVVGPRGLTGRAYLGHVFWDTDVFLMPFLAATWPAAARAVLEYRLRRLPAAQELAAASGRDGARFPWESATTGHDVTPRIHQPHLGPPIPILTGQHEEHIVADVAWAAATYADWTGDDAPARALLPPTARYWASRVRMDTDGGHIEDVIGPDEYHERVDDDVFTNVMARWTLRTAAALGNAADEEARRWRTIADALVDGLDPATGRYEQFRGYHDLEPLVMAELGPVPVPADLVHGRERIAGSQIIKQPDVLMLHHLVPQEVVGLAQNLAFYGPRTAHGSSLSPAVHASLLARAGRLDEAARWFGLAARLDLDDITGTTAGGVHLATCGGVWQALAQGFLGLRPTGGLLEFDPRIPEQWGTVTMRLAFRGQPLLVRASADHASLEGPTGAWRRTQDGRWSPP
jgi:beta-phosphoglucomutase family hydrolase